MFAAFYFDEGLHGDICVATSCTGKGFEEDVVMRGDIRGIE